MRATVKVLRVGGARKADRDISADPGTAGELRLSMVAQLTQMNISDASDLQFKRLVPMLYHASLVATHDDRIQFHGMAARRVEGAVVQGHSITLRQLLRDATPDRG